MEHEDKPAVASLGGKARAVSLSAEERKAIATVAAEARWARQGRTPVPVASHTGEIKIGSGIPCAVLDDGTHTRVLSERGVSKALGSKRGGSHWRRKRKAAEEGGAELPVYMSANNLRPFISYDLGLALSKPIIYRVPISGAIANGIDATLLPKVCEVWLNARDAGVLTKPQERMAHAAGILLAGLAHTGIVALVDEATGFQDDRAKDALAKILEAFVAKEIRPYLKHFPTDFYKEMYRLRGWHWPQVPAEQSKRSPRVGKDTDDIVYDRLAPGVKQKLKSLIPRYESGRLKHKMFQRLTEDVGDPKLREHLASVVALMKAADTWHQFKEMINRALPRYAPLPLFDQAEEEQENAAIVEIV
jgi:hypothetical protein